MQLFQFFTINILKNFFLHTNFSILNLLFFNILFFLIFLILKKNFFSVFLIRILPNNPINLPIFSTKRCIWNHRRPSLPIQSRSFTSKPLLNLSWIKRLKQLLPRISFHNPYLSNRNRIQKRLHTSPNKRHRLRRIQYKTHPKSTSVVILHKTDYFFQVSYRNCV